MEISVYQRIVAFLTKRHTSGIAVSNDGACFKSDKFRIKRSLHLILNPFGGITKRLVLREPIQFR